MEPDAKTLFDELANAGMRGQRAAPGHPNTVVVKDYILQGLSRSTVFRQYVARLGRGPGTAVSNTLPWHAEGERQHAACYLALCGHPEGPTLAGFAKTLDPLDSQSVGVTAAAAALHGSVYLWFQEIEDLADAAPLPRHVVNPNVMPHPVMFWSRDNARVFEDGGENNWWLLIRTPRAIELYGDVVYPHEERVEIRVGHLPFGTVFPTGLTGEEADSARRVLARLAFLNSPYVSAEAGRIPRAWRREAGRMVEPVSPSDPAISVVQLRRDARESVQRQREAESEGATWKHQWWVSGHYRAQWYPSDEAHRVIWIAPYLKGPADLPIVQKVYTVVR